MSNIVLCFQFSVGHGAVEIFVRKMVNRRILSEYVDFYEHNS